MHDPRRFSRLSGNGSKCFNRDRTRSPSDILLDVDSSKSDVVQPVAGHRRFWLSSWIGRLHSDLRHSKQKKMMHSFLFVDTVASNQPMKPTAPSRGNFRVFATTPCRGSSLSR